MKILHLNTHSYGGAAVVARRLHRAALAEGIQSSFVTKFGSPTDSTVGYRPLRDARLRYALRAGAADPRLYKIGKFVQRRLQHKNLVNRPAGFEVFSPLNTQNEFSDCAELLAPDVVHLHWVAGFLDHRGFFERNRDRKFVWTLHDMNPFTGGCHHADGCEQFRDGCSACPQLAGTIDDTYSARVLAAKADALRCLRDDQLTIAAPSQWLLDLSAASPVTGRFRHVRIDNPSFDVAPSQSAFEDRMALGLPANRKILLFVADNLRNPRKGIDLIFEAARRMQFKDRVHLVGIGQKTDVPSGVSVSFTGRIKDESQLARYFAAADALVVASVAENAPLSIIEAMTCGTPVVALAMGGVPELVDGDCGQLVTTRDADDLANALDDTMYTRRYDRDVIRAKAAVHAPRHVLNQYLNVYHEMAAV